MTRRGVTSGGSRAGRPPSSPRSLWILLRKELQVGLRSASLYLLVGVPLLVSLVMRVVLSGGGTKPPRLAVVGPERPALARVIERLAEKGRPPIRLITGLEEAEARRRLARGKLHGLLALPPDFDAAVAAGRRPRATLYFDEAGGSSAFTLRPLVRELMRLQAGQQDPVRLEVRGIRGISAWEAMLPAWVVMVLLSAITLMPSSIASERQSKTLQAVLVTPVGLWEYVAGKGLYGVLVGAAGGVLVLAANGALVGNLPLVIILLLLGAAVATGIGLLLGLLLETPQSASGVATAIYIPLLWGAFFADLSGVVGTLSRLTPSYHVAQGLRRALYSGGTRSEQWLIVGGLALLVVILGGVAVWALRRAEQRM